MKSIIRLFGENEVRFVNHPENKYEFGIIAHDFAKILESKQDGSQISRSVDDSWKSLVPIETSRGTQNMIVIWEPGIRQILTTSRKSKAKEIAYKLGLDEIIVQPKETKTITIIKNAFSHLKPVEQIAVLGYRIDLYFTEQCLAIECDEKHHLTSAQKQYDIKRQEKITKILGCKWIRYNPDEPGFCVGNVINKIIQATQE